MESGQNPRSSFEVSFHLPCQNVSADGINGEVDPDAMEMDVTDRQACFVLLRKFVREVGILPLYNAALK